MSSIIKNKKIMTFIYIGIVIAILITAYFLAFRETKPKEGVIVLNGNEYFKLPLKQEYNDEGFSFMVDDEEISLDDLDYDIEDDINEDVLGQYTVTYHVNFEDKDYDIKRYVEVVDNVAPDLVINQEYVSKYYCKKEDKVLLDYRAEDNYDGIITDKVKEEIFADHVELSVEDSSGNKTTKDIPIKMINDEDAAIIELKGSEIIYLAEGSKYVEEGASLTDGCGKKQDDSLEITGNVDTSKTGEYLIKYSYTSAAGVVTSKTRKVIVYAKHQGDHKTEEGKSIYLTFDDGPGAYTEEILDILKKYDVKATFFVTNQFKKYVPLIKREYEEGHAIGVHTLTHKWNVYRSVETYLKDFNDMNQIIYNYTGQRTKIFRFPGGSSNTVSKNYSLGVVSAIASRMTEDGYVYFDWNVDSEDAAMASTSKITQNVIKGIDSKKVPVILMHDIHKNTLAALETIIKYALDNGYTFKTLSTDSQTCHHTINN